MDCLSRLSSLLFILLLLSFPFRAARIYKSREDAFALLEAKEGRLYFDSCEQSSNRASCVFAMDTSYTQEPTQCSMSIPESRPWWLAIIETPAYVSSVTILNIDNSFRSYQDALKSFVIMANDEICYRLESEESFVKRSFPCDALGDQILIQSNLVNSLLGICDVEIMGAPLKFPTILSPDDVLALSTCRQSSDESPLTSCDNALDLVKTNDHTVSACAITNPEHAPWFEAMLYIPSMVTEVRLYNRFDKGADGLQDFIITVDQRVCVLYQGEPFEAVGFPCKYFGNKVRIASNLNKSISLCELEVVGHEAALSEGEKYKLQGCHKDVAADRDLTQLVSSMLMTPKKCYRMCKRIEMKYFGLQNGKFCFCGTNFGKHGSAAENSKCNFICEGGRSEGCGGELQNLVYEIL